MITQNSFRNTTDKIQDDLGNLGYTLSGQKSEQKNEVSVSGVSYSRYWGYGSAMKNNYWTYSEYSFMDTLNNDVTYTLKYQEVEDYVDAVELIGCSARKNYNEICGSGGVVRTRIEEMNSHPDATLTEYNAGTTAVVAASVSLGFALLTLILVLVL